MTLPETPLEIAKRVIKGYADFTDRHGENPCEDGEQIFLREMHKLAKAYEAALRALEASQRDRDRLALIVRERTHRVGGCLCERCVEDEYQTAKVIAEIRARVKELEAELAKERSDG